ncbi:GNAT family N-acetyltransferase [Maritimibacter sp. UBA3975]|uniref:GNAT family N-acetyltransferase n=1 Tax=Maritimibacter sp. UBA3975 TaxID=1946833 RepID=UPI0025C537A4|nr:GNAT family N-acetyltransferase [Maritimibacter sp. UBA3975]|tara:strand:+ start:2281 stop:2733 length:453 start_codon:yes stop_codon:yes gene_type:complete
MTRFTFRPIVPSDHPALAALWRESASVMGLDNSYLPSVADLTTRLDTHFGPGWEMTLAEDGDRMAGFLAIHPQDRVLGQLFLHPDVIGEGLGHLFFDRAKARMPQGFTLYTPAENHRARAFYEAGGMHVTHHTTHPEFGHEVVYYHWPGT